MSQPQRFLIFSLVLSAGCFASANDVNRHLEGSYLHKILVLRGFYAGTKLHYDSSGSVSGGVTGDWTTDGLLRVNKVKVSGDNVKIEADRLLVVSVGRSGLQIAGDDILNRDKLREKNAKKALVEIEAELDKSGVTDETVNAAMAKIFLTSQDSFADAVPEYWRTCITDGMSGKNPNCALSAEMSLAPSMANPSQKGVPPPPHNDSGGTRTSVGVFRVGGAVKPPRATYQPDPTFSEPARRVKYQGVTVLALIVDADGIPRTIRIQSPVGAGLDEKAVHAVETWKFKPAQKDGQPVPVAIAVEVDFHLY